MKLYRKLDRKTLSKLAALIVLGGGTLLPMAAEAAEAETASTAAAEESAASETPSYTMGEMVVTATRTEKREIDVPMATEVITEEDIKESGATNAAEVLSKVNGMTFNAYGAGGASMGTMSNDVIIRGMKEATLVLVNGNPIDMRGKYYLNDISADAIERIEIVKGGGSTLYGSSAMAGVINIIMKTDAANSVTVGFGNFGQQKYHLNVGTNGLMVTYDRNRAAHFDEGTISETAKKGSTRTEVSDPINQSATISYKLNDNLSFFYGHYDTHASFNRWVLWSNEDAKAGDLLQDRDYITIRDMAQVNYRDSNWKGSLYYNTGTIESRGFNYFGSSTYKIENKWYNTREKNGTFGLDVQRNWTIGKGILTAGFSGQHETYQALPAPSTGATAVRDEARNNWGVFAQWDQKIDKKNSFIIGGRETWSTNTSDGKNFSNFSASGQFLHKMDDANTLFLNISQSFIMPTLNAIFKDKEPAPLKPQKGINYEIGWKNMTGKHTWKASLFLMRIKDNISATYNGPGDWKFKNEDFNNEGLELSYAVECKNGFSYNAGLTWQNPRAKGSGDKAVAKKQYWDEQFGKIQIVGGVSYKKDKWRASFQGSYLDSRCMTPTGTPHVAVRPYFLTTLTVAYAPTNKSEFELKINNVFDRHDVLTHTSSKYYAAPTNFLFSFTQKF